MALTENCLKQTWESDNKVTQNLIWLPSMMFRTLCTLMFFMMAATPAIAATELSIDGDTPAFQNRELTAGAIRVSVSYRPYNSGADNPNEENNLRYQLYHSGSLKVEDAAATMFVGGVKLQDLDNNGSSEVIVQTYSGGAHCCTNFTIYDWQGERFTKTETGNSDGGGGEFKDLDGDRRLEFVTYDNAFLYTFSSYAGSFPPSRILSYRNGQFANVTRNYPQELRSTAWRMYQAFQERRGDSDINGLLAGYVAQKILLGEYQQGWDFMLVHYDRNSDWGLDIYQGDRVVGRYRDFPTALRQFLIEQGYLTR